MGAGSKHSKKKHHHSKSKAEPSSSVVASVENGNGNRKKKGCKSKNSGYSEEDAEFRRQLEANDFTIREMDADGNCMFRSLSDQLYGDYGNKYYTDVREEVVNYLENHEDEFKFFVVDDDGKEDEDFSASFQDYVSRMRQDGEWAGNTELVCASRFFQRNIVVFTAGGTLKIDYEPEQANAGKKKVAQESAPSLYISYHDNDHYNSCHSSNIIKPSSKTETKERKQQITIESNQKKNDMCACGSGTKYKHCCFVTKKRQKRLAKVKVANELKKDGKIDENDHNNDESSIEVEGNFRVLRI